MKACRTFRLVSIRPCCAALAAASTLAMSDRAVPPGPDQVLRLRALRMSSRGSANAAVRTRRAACPRSRAEPEVEGRERALAGRSRAARAAAVPSPFWSNARIVSVYGPGRDPVSRMRGSPPPSAGRSTPSWRARTAGLPTPHLPPRPDRARRTGSRVAAPRWSGTSPVRRPRPSVTRPADPVLHGKVELRRRRPAGPPLLLRSRTPAARERCGTRRASCVGPPAGRGSATRKLTLPPGSRTCRPVTRT